MRHNEMICAEISCEYKNGRKFLRTKKGNAGDIVRLVEGLVEEGGFKNFVVKIKR